MHNLLPAISYIIIDIYQIILLLLLFLEKKIFYRNCVRCFVYSKIFVFFLLLFFYLLLLLVQKIFYYKIFFILIYPIYLLLLPYYTTVHHADTPLRFQLQGSVREKSSHICAYQCTSRAIDFLVASSYSMF